MHAHEEELALVSKAQQGDREALGKLWDTITPKLFGYLVNTVRDKRLAEDILQATWLKAAQALPTYTHRGHPFSSWLFAIARNECRQHWRKSNREVPFIDTEHELGQVDAGTSEKILIEQILSKLSEADRELLRLRYIADLSIKDIAQVLNSNSMVVRVRLHRALGRAQLIANKSI